METGNDEFRKIIHLKKFNKIICFFKLMYNCLFFFTKLITNQQLITK